MILGSLTKRITCTAIETQETRDTKKFPWGNHKGENPTTSSEIELAPKEKAQKQ